MARFLTIGRHLEYAIQTELVLEPWLLALIERKQSRRFRHYSIICEEDTKGFALDGTVPTLGQRSYRG